MWQKAKLSKFKHYYRNGKAICGSTAAPHDEITGWQENVAFSPKCDHCKIELSRDPFQTRAAQLQLETESGGVQNDQQDIERTTEIKNGK